ncbi:MAG: hypothetical protein CVU38_06155 [Chloroflexi bacterium HGW-Chloroflexi-1]|nr:MAG: hypothetical protein CVU38_06155 [Chloroflexi bacterium HGW-Chloroflexi-1]
MARTPLIARLPGATYAVSNTGPLISAFQSDSFLLLGKVFAAVYVQTACVIELERHGWGPEIQAASSKLVQVSLTTGEEERAKVFAERIAEQAGSSASEAAKHMGEAQAIVLALRPEYCNDLLLLDESAARAVAKEAGLRLSGFPGALLLAVRSGLILAEDLRTRLEICRQQGTHYGAAFIQQVYVMAKQGRRTK